LASRLRVAGYPDASPHMDAGYPVHVWGCRCHPVTVTYRGPALQPDGEQTQKAGAVTTYYLLFHRGILYGVVRSS